MVMIYIRHGNDDDRNSTYRDDAKLTDKGMKKSKEKCKHLVEQYGIPKVIVCSPFIRARQTAIIFKKYIKYKYGISVKVKIDITLGRFFSTSERANPDVRDETLKYKPLIEKSTAEMDKRLENHKNRVIARGYHKVEDKIWCISHGIIMARFMKLYGLVKKSDTHVDFLRHFVVPI